MARGDFCFAFNGPGLKWLDGDRSVLTCAVDLRRGNEHGPSVPGKKLTFVFRGEDIGEAVTASDGVAMMKAELTSVEPDKQYDLSIRVDGDEEKYTVTFRTPKAPPARETPKPWRIAVEQIWDRACVSKLLISLFAEDESLVGQYADGMISDGTKIQALGIKNGHQEYNLDPDPSGWRLVKIIVGGNPAQNWEVRLPVAKS